MATYGSAKSDVMAVMEESTAGTLVDPGAATDYVALQPDVQMQPNFEVLENDEIRASIGKSKPIQGLEQPPGSFSHYLKHSGTEGTAPEFDSMWKSLLGSKTANGTQRTTTSGSAVGSIVLGAGGSDFSRGFAVLVKDGTNGYSIRPVHSVSTNTLTPGFNLANAPATGIGVGKCVNFSPANTGHPSLSMHHYRGAGQLYQAIAGAVVTEAQISVKAGQLINTAFSFAGTKYFFNPIRITSATKYLDFDEGGADFLATLEVKVYRDPHELASAIQTAMNAAGGAATYTVVYLNNTSGSEGKFKFTASTGTFNILWNTGTNTANSIASKLGFSTAADSTGALNYTSTTAQSYTSPYTPSYDSSDPLAAKYQEVMVGDATDYACFCVDNMNITVTNTVNNVLCVCAESGVDQKKVAAREVKITLQALIDKHDADKFKRYRANTDTRFAFNFGTRSGGNWVAGTCGNLYVPTCVVSKFQLTTLENMVSVEMELTGFVDSSGNGEVYLNFL